MVTKQNAMKYTINQFRKDYPNDAACLDKLFELRYGNMECCPKCSVANPEYKRITKRQCFQCRDCYYQIYPMAGTIFQKSTTPLTYWFYAIYLMTVTRNGVSAKELQRVLGVTYKTAWRMALLLRQLMGRNKKTQLTGTVEMDETYVGGIFEKKTGRAKEKIPVFAMVERRGEVVAQKVDDVKKSTLFPIIEEYVNKKAKVMTDEFSTYVNLGLQGYDNHQTINHSLKNYVVSEVSTNTVEGFFSQLKRMIKGTHIHVSRQYIQYYIDECCFRYNNRKRPGEMFNLMLGAIS
jgi:transposase